MRVISPRDGQARTVIGDLAHHRAGLPPQRNVTDAAAVPDRVGQQLVHRDHEVVQPGPGQPGRLGAGRDGMPQAGDPAAVEALGEQDLGADASTVFQR
jgi:hypothetical protein